MSIDCNDNNQKYNSNDWKSALKNYKEACKTTTTSNYERFCINETDDFYNGNLSLNNKNISKNIKEIRDRTKRCIKLRENFLSKVKKECRDKGHYNIIKFLENCVIQYDNLLDSLEELREERKRRLKEPTKDIKEIVDEIEARGKNMVFGPFLKRKNKDKTIRKHRFRTLDELFEWCYRNNKNPVDYDNSWIIPPEWEDFKTLKKIQEEEKIVNSLRHLSRS